MIDAEWVADLLRHGLLQPSFIPPRPIRELRELTRYRESVGREQTALANRIQKLIESANIKLGQVASAALGVRGKLMWRALANGETDAEKLSHWAYTSLKRKPPQLQQALEGRLTQAPRWILGQLLDQYEQAQRRSSEWKRGLGRRGRTVPTLSYLKPSSCWPRFLVSGRPWRRSS